MCYFCAVESNRQKKIAGVLQKDLAYVLQNVVNGSELRGTIVSVTKVRVTVDLSIAKVYLSIFPVNKSSEVFKGLDDIKSQIKHELAQLTKNQLRRMPGLEFFLDDSLDYIDGIDRSLKGLDNPLEQPGLLQKRKKK